MSIIPPNFQSILNIDTKDAQRPPQLPMGTYVGLIKDPPEFGNSSQKNTPFVKFKITPTQAYADVSEEDLEDYGPDLSKAFAIPTTFYITDGAKHRLTEFLADCGLETENSNFLDLIPQVQGREVLITVKHVPSNQGDGRTYVNIVGTAPIPA